MHAVDPPDVVGRPVRSLLLFSLSTRPLALSALCAAATFVLDLSVPRGYAVHSAYVAVVLSGLCWPRRASVVGGAALCGLLTVLGDVGSWSSGSAALAAANRVQTLVLLAAAAAVVVSYRRSCARRADLAAIVESSDDAIVSVSADGIVRSWNAAAAALLGIRRRRCSDVRHGPSCRLSGRTRVGRS